MVNWEANSELQDFALTAEIELLGDVVEAVTHAGRRLSPREIDRALGVGENRHHRPTPLTTAASASPESDVAYEAAQ
jgi:hypothetical protein